MMLIKKIREKTYARTYIHAYIPVCPCKIWFFEESSMHHSRTDWSSLPEATHLLSWLNATLLTEPDKNGNQNNNNNNKMNRAKLNSDITGGPTKVC